MALSRKTYDTDSITLRRIFAYDPITNSPPSTGYILTSLTKGVASFTTPLSTLSTIGWTEIPGQISTLEGLFFTAISSFQPNYPSSADVFLPSTVAGLGSAGYVSSLELTESLISTTEGLGSAGYISTSQLDATLVSTVEGLGSLGYISSSELARALVSTTEGLGSADYISSSQLNSTTYGIVNDIGNLGFLSIESLQSTVAGLGTSGYLSSAIFQSPVTSTTVGLGTLGYVSSSQLTSTIEGLGTLGYLSSLIFQGPVTSTTIGLGTIGYVSSSQVASSIEGLATSGYISTSQLTSTVEGLATSGYISSSQMTSTTQGLGTLGYLSSLAPIYRSTYSNNYIGNWSNISYLYSNNVAGTTLSTISFDIGDKLREQINYSTTKLDLEFKTNIQFGYYDATSRDYQFNTLLVRGTDLVNSNIIGSESLTYYIINAALINVPYFNLEKNRFLITSLPIISTLRDDSNFSSLTLFHTFGPNVPTTNQFFASPMSTACVSVTLDNTPPQRFI